MVYCIEVADNHTVIAGRNGTMHVTGQSLSGKWGEKRSQAIRGNIKDPHTADLICSCPSPPTVYPASSMCTRCGNPILEFAHHSICDDWISINGCRQPDPKSAFPILIAYITAYGRIKLFEERLQYGNQTHEIIYCDTDSCMSTDVPPIEVGPNLGQWERIVYEHFVAFAPKYYEYMWKTNEKGERFTGTLKLKGVPGRAKVVYECFNKHETPEQLLPDDCRCCPICGVPMNDECKYFKFERPVKLSESITRKMHPNTWISYKKHISRLDNKRIKNNDGTSKPITVDEKRYTKFTELMGHEPIAPDGNL